MNDSMRVEVLEGTNDLRRVALHFQFVQPFTPLKQFVHTCVLAKLEQDVHIFAVFEEVLEMANICMLDTSVNLDLAHQLLLGATLSQTTLLNDLGSVHKFRLGIDEFETFGKASLAKEFALEVAADPDFSVLLLKFLLH